MAFAVARVTSQQEVSDLNQLMDVPILQTVTCGEVSDLSKRSKYHLPKRKKRKIERVGVKFT